MKRLLPKNFTIPKDLETNKFRLRMLTISDVAKDFEAVMASVDHLQKTKPFGPNSNFPPSDLTIEEDYESIKIHEKEIQNRNSFAFIVLNLAETKSLGCVYIYPSVNPKYDAVVMMWVRQSEAKTGLDRHLFETVKLWIKNKWPFSNPGYPGRDIDWKTWESIE